jgi:hypothetical protein
MANPVILIANGDLRLSANQKCWPAQQRVEEAVTAAIRAGGFQVERGHPYDAAKGHGFIDSQKRGMEVFRGIPEHAPLVVVEAVWQYSHPKAIMGIFDEGLHGHVQRHHPRRTAAPTGVFKERLSQSALYAEMRATSDAEAQAVRWLDAKGMKFRHRHG